jgi:hypothetical protein
MADVSSKILYTLDMADINSKIPYTLEMVNIGFKIGGVFVLKIVVLITFYFYM